ncbi:hypothetical protein KOAAANKH_03885 [Brevundimonas sp. NIBR10]|uniref:hypothetical protein n=1 Tax=Brevundimonas sp. NIBR10 TaxID=3015997 RepID=UPI0022F18495|nr:hypothetical protein [Brevundimonas sp. NIBR10]WGM48970.1 hypothetical protein KOAAANKH_03885 [Brevundimonas sp. NIBR10]
MSLREKQLWISLIVGTAVWSLYGWRLAHLVGRTEGSLALSAGLAFLVALGAVVVTEAVGSAVVGWLQRRHRPAQDAALTEAALIAGHVALMVLVGLIVLTLASLWLFALWAETRLETLSMAAALTPRTLVLIANLLLACIVLAEGVRTVLTLMLVRRRR